MTNWEQRFTVPPASDEELARYYQAHPQTFGAVPFDEARPGVVRAVSDERRTALVADWVAGLRRRADVIDLYLLPAR